MNFGIRVKKLNENAIIPTQGSEYAAGYDLYALGDYQIAPHSTIKIGTGLSFAFPEHTFGAIFARSGLASKKGLRPANCTGVVDADYRGEIIVALHNDTDELMEINNKDKIAQLILLPYIPMDFIEVDELDNTERGEGGFGSTGK